MLYLSVRVFEEGGEGAPTWTTGAGCWSLSYSLEHAQSWQISVFNMLPTNGEKRKSIDITNGISMSNQTGYINIVL